MGKRLIYCAAMLAGATMGTAAIAPASAGTSSQPIETKDVKNLKALDAYHCFPDPVSGQNTFVVTYRQSPRDTGGIALQVRTPDLVWHNVLSVQDATGKPSTLTVYTPTGAPKFYIDSTHTTLIPYTVVRAVRVYSEADPRVVSNAIESANPDGSSWGDCPL